jgi:hypothetical protein
LEGNSAMRVTLGAIALACLVIATALLTGFYVDFTVAKVTSWDQILDRFNFNIDFARKEEWSGYTTDDTGDDAEIHEESVSTVLFTKSNKIVGSVLDVADPPGWDIVGFNKSGMKLFTEADPDTGAGLYLLKAVEPKINTRPHFNNTVYSGYRFSWMSETKMAFSGAHIY